MLLFFPNKLLIDRGKEFLAQIALEVYKLLGINKISTTTSYHTQGNPVERLHRDLKSLLLKFIIETGKDWPEGLPYALMAHNQSVHSSIGMTPYEALFSRSPRIPERFFCYTGPISGLNMIDHMKNTFHTARSLMYQSQHRNEQSKKFQMAKQVYYEPGDIVMLNFGKTRDKKMQVYDKGLFIVVSENSPKHL